MAATDDGADSDEVGAVYALLAKAVPSKEVAEELTIEVCGQLRATDPDWLGNRSKHMRRYFFCVQAVLRHRGTL